MIQDATLVIEEAVNITPGSTYTSNNFIDLNELRDAVPGEPLAVVFNIIDGTVPTAPAKYTFSLVSSNNGTAPTGGFGDFSIYFGMPDPTEPTRQAYPDQFILPLPQNGNFERYLTISIDAPASTAPITVKAQVMPLKLAMNGQSFRNVYKDNITI